MEPRNARVLVLLLATGEGRMHHRAAVTQRPMIRLLVKLLPARKNRASTQRLMSLYLLQTNTKDCFSSEIQRTRQRQNGKNTHVRERV
jgi:hypothetical protein